MSFFLIACGLGISSTGFAGLGLCDDPNVFLPSPACLFILVGVSRLSERLDSTEFEVSAFRFPRFSTNFHSSNTGSGLLTLLGSVHSLMTPPKLRELGFAVPIVLFAVCWRMVCFGSDVLCFALVFAWAMVLAGEIYCMPPWGDFSPIFARCGVCNRTTELGVDGMYCSSGLGSSGSYGFVCFVFMSGRLLLDGLGSACAGELTVRSASITCCRRSIFASRSWNFDSLASSSCSFCCTS